MWTDGADRSPSTCQKTPKSAPSKVADHLESDRPSLLKGVTGFTLNLGIWWEQKQLQGGEISQKTGGICCQKPRPVTQTEENYK